MIYKITLFILLQFLNLEFLLALMYTLAQKKQRVYQLDFGLLEYLHEIDSIFKCQLRLFLYNSSTFNPMFLGIADAETFISFTDHVQIITNVP